MDNRLQETIDKTITEMLNACVFRAKHDVCMPGDIAHLAEAVAELIKAAAEWSNKKEARDAEEKNHGQLDSLSDLGL